MHAHIATVAGSTVGALALSAAFASGVSAQTSPQFCQNFSGSSTTFVNSQKYPAASSAYSDTGAADFTIPSGGCVFDMVDALGMYSGPSPATKVNILIKGGTTHPTGSDLAPASFHNITTFFSSQGGDFEVTLPTQLSLAPGHYWLIFQPKMPAGSTWGWRTNPTPTGAPDVWRNPGNGWACGTGWLPVNTPCVSSTTDVDLDFQLAFQ